jgi:large conductance mechanosensitive channel
MSFFQEFKEFAMKGNVIDLAVGVVIGGAFGKIVSSLVSDVIMPPVGLMTGGLNFTDLKLVLRPEAVSANGKTLAAVTLNYGNFIQTTVDFLLIALSIFLVVQGVNRLRRLRKVEMEAASSEKVATSEPSQEVQLLGEIRDLLKTRCGD